MTVAAAEAHAHDAGHAHHWETSTAPVAITFGILFLVPLTFASLFVYENVKLAALMAGIGLPLLLFGVSKWVAEGLAHKNMVEGAAAIAFPMFIGSEVFMFLALFVGYWTLRLTAPAWPPAGTPDLQLGLPLTLLAVMVLSSVAVFAAGQRHAAGNLKGFRSALLLAILLGVAFLVGTGVEYSRLNAEGFNTATNAFSTAYYAITGFHAAHVFLGVTTFLFMFFPALSGRTNATFVLCASAFWYFLTIASVFTITQIYLW